MAITFDAATQAINLYAEITDAASAAYDYTVTRGLVVCDAWAQIIDSAASDNAHTVQLQTAAGAANITGTIAFAGGGVVARGTITRAGTILSANSTLAAAATLRYNVVRVVAGANPVAVNAVCYPA